MVFIDYLINENKEINEESETITYKKALTIGFFQCIAMVPGVSRSAATIVGGLTQKLNRKTAAEFSFFLAVPTMFAATGYKLYKFYEETKATGLSITQDQTMMLLVGNLVAFIVAMIAIKSFITYLTKHGFKLFGYYRTIVGIIIIILVVSGVDLKVV